MQSLLNFVDSHKSLLRMTLTLLIANFIAAAIACFWADSEGWPLKVAAATGEVSKHYVYGIKPLFYWVLFPLTVISKNLGVHGMDVGRIFFALNGIFIAFLGARLLEKLGTPRAMGIVYIMVLLSAPLFLGRGFRVRSDLLASMFFMLHLHFLISHKFVGSPMKRLGTHCLLAWLVLLSTLKAGLLYVAFFPFFYKYIKRSNYFSLSGGQVGVMALSFFIIMGIYLPSLNDQFSYLAESLYVGGKFDLFSLYRFEHVIRFIIKNWYLLLGGGLLTLISVIYNKERQIPVSCLCLLAGIIFVFPNRMPYFLAAYLPFFLLFPMLQAHDWGRLPFQWKAPKVLFYLGLAGLLFIGFKTSIHTIRHHSNKPQRSFIHEFHESIRQKHYKIYDPSGLVMGGRHYHFYLGPGQHVKNMYTLKNIIEMAPDIILKAQRWGWIERFFRHPSYFSEPNAIYRVKNITEVFDKKKQAPLGAVMDQFPNNSAEIRLVIELKDGQKILGKNSLLFNSKNKTRKFTRGTLKPIDRKLFDTIAFSPETGNIYAFEVLHALNQHDLDLGYLLRFDSDF